MTLNKKHEAPALTVIGAEGMAAAGLGTAIVRWTGRGKLGDLRSSVAAVCRVERAGARVRSQGATILVETPEPVGIATALQCLPGVSWIAVGYSAGSFAGVGKKASALARIHLRKGRTFSVVAESDSKGATPMDVSGAVSAAILGAVKGIRVRDDRPDYVFRVAYEGGRGAVGVQLKEGPGGTPVGSATATCLISGGMHSSVVAWHALTCGFSVRLLHVASDEESLREVARLYSELSNRVDPSKVELEVFEGGSVLSAALSGGRPGGRIFGGFHSGCGEVPGRLEGVAEAPLYLLTEEEFREGLSRMALKGHAARRAWEDERGEAGGRRVFGGKRADMHGVIDGLR